MLTGRRAFDGSSMASLAQKIKRGVYRPVSTSYSQDIRTLLQNLLVLAPKTRPTADDLLRHSVLRDALSTFVSEVIVRSKPHESRPDQQHKLGEGTREISLALLNMHNGEHTGGGPATNGSGGGGGGVASVNSLTSQLASLGLQSVVKDAFRKYESENDVRKHPTSLATGGGGLPSLPGLLAVRAHVEELTREEEKIGILQDAMSRTAKALVSWTSPSPPPLLITQMRVVFGWESPGVTTRASTQN